MSMVRVLVVEDNEFWQDLIREELENYNCDVDVVSDYREAKGRLDHNVYDMVTLDMLLSPDERERTFTASGGWRLLVNQLIQSFPGTAIFVISGSFGDEPKLAFDLNRKYGVRGFMDKGKDFDPETLRKWVDEVREFKEVGGRPDVGAEQLTDVRRQQQEHLIKLHRILSTHFDENELRTLCFNLGVDYDDLPGKGKANKARELTGYSARHGRISELVKTGKELRPDIVWEDASE